MQRLYSGRLIEFLHSKMCAGAYTGGSKLDFTWLRSRRSNELADAGDASRLARDEYIGLPRERKNRDEILYRVIWEVLQERPTVCLSVGVY